MPEFKSDENNNLKELNSTGKLDIVYFSPNYQPTQDIIHVLDQNSNVGTEHYKVLHNLRELTQEIESISSLESGTGANAIFVDFNAFDYDPKVPPHLQTQHVQEMATLLKTIGRQEKKIAADMDAAGGPTKINKLKYREGIPLVIIGEANKETMKQFMYEMGVKNPPEHFITVNKTKLLDTAGTVAKPGFLDQLANRRHDRLSELQLTSV